MARYNTTVTKKDGTKASGYIENGRGYYNDGSAIGAGDSIVDKQGTVWTKPDTASTGAGGTGSGTGAGAGTGSGTGAPSTIDLINQAIRDNNSGGGGSSSGSYRVSGIDKPVRSSYLRSARELADLYDINYDMDAIRNLYDDATAAKYELLSKERLQAENDFYTNNANANATLLDTLKKATSSAIATGASRGLAGAEQLGLMMEQQQAITDEATNLAQERANMADEIAAEKAENIIKALEYSDSLKKALATTSANVYVADTDYDIGELNWAAQMKNVEALFEQIAAEERANRAALEANAKEGELNRASNERIAALNRAAYGSGGGYGSGYNSKYTDDSGNLDYNKIWAAGDVPMMIQYLMGIEGMTLKDAQKRIKSDKQFVYNSQHGGYSTANDIDNIRKKAIAEGDTATLSLLNAIGENDDNWWDYLDDVAQTMIQHPILSLQYAGNYYGNGIKNIGQKAVNGAKDIGNSIWNNPNFQKALNGAKDVGGDLKELLDNLFK